MAYSIKHTLLLTETAPQSTTFQVTYLKRKKKTKLIKN